MVWVCLCSALLAAGCRTTRPAATGAQNGNKTPPTANTKPIARTSVAPGSGNGPTPAPAPPIPKATKEIRVGEVRVIGSGRRFVLIEVSPRPDMPLLAPGVELRTRAPAGVAVGGEQTGTLRVSPERRQPFIVADVVDGEPHANDLVYYSSENQLHLVPSILTTPIYPPPTGNGSDSGGDNPATTPRP